MLNDYSNLWNEHKVGTLIVSHYRNGSHFLNDVIVDQFDRAKRKGEICEDNTIDELAVLTNNDSDYKVCILNACQPKFYLVDSDLLSKWHVVNLTRKNKIDHFISYWFWFQNSDHERVNGSGVFGHHGTDSEVYRTYANKIKQHVPVELVIQWLQEQLINYHIRSDFSIDYNDLKDLSTKNIKWNPNQYKDIKLEDIVINADEIKNLLLKFNLKSYA